MLFTKVQIDFRRILLKKGFTIKFKIYIPKDYFFLYSKYEFLGRVRTVFSSCFIMAFFVFYWLAWDWLHMSKICLVFACWRSLWCDVFACAQTIFSISCIAFFYRIDKEMLKNIMGIRKNSIFWQIIRKTYWL